MLLDSQIRERLQKIVPVPENDGYRQDSKKSTLNRCPSRSDESNQSPVSWRISFPLKRTVSSTISVRVHPASDECESPSLTSRLHPHNPSAASRSFIWSWPAFAVQLSHHPLNLDSPLQQGASKNKNMRSYRPFTLRNVYLFQGCFAAVAVQSGTYRRNTSVCF